MDPTTPPPLPLPVGPAGHDLSMLGLVMQADPVVKGVMLLLLVASVACWAIIVEKAARLAALRRQAARLEAVAVADGLRVEAGRKGPAAAAAAIVGAGRREWGDWTEGAETRAEYRERVERAMREAAAAEVRRLEPGLPFLATVGSAAPFVGLFGTVWGIMSSFTSIAASNDTSLAVVAPGIAEALFATAVGLAAAIPAVVAYNKLSTALGRAQERMMAAIAAIGGRMSGRPPSAPPAPLGAAA